MEMKPAYGLTRGGTKRIGANNSHSTESGRSNGANKLFILTNFKWGLSPDRTSK